MIYISCVNHLEKNVSILFLATKEAYVRNMAEWQLKCISDFIFNFISEHEEWLEFQQEIISFLRERGPDLVNLHWHVRNTQYAGGAVGGVSTGLGIAALSTLWFPPLSLGLGLAAAGVGAAGGVMKLGNTL